MVFLSFGLLYAVSLCFCPASCDYTSVFHLCLINILSCIEELFYQNYLQLGPKLHLHNVIGDSLCLKQN